MKGRRNKLYRDNPEMEHEETDASLKKELWSYYIQTQKKIYQTGKKKI